MQVDEVRKALELAKGSAPQGAAVLVCLVEEPDGLGIVLEVRASTLDIQPGEVCLPGGHIEWGETPREAAVREACEELLVEPGQIEIIGDMGAQRGPGGMPLHVFVATPAGYEGTFSPAEADRTFTLSLDWLLAHEPDTYDVALVPSYPEDYPWELVPKGRDYPWKARVNEVPFYRTTDPLVWGATARVLARLASVLREAQLA